MNSLQTTSSEATQRPWNVEAFEFQMPAPTVEYLSSAQPTDLLDVPTSVRLTLDLRLPMARRLLKEDARDLGPINEEVLNEVRSRWQG